VRTSAAIRIQGALEALNGVCPYYTMFPLEFPMRALRRSGSVKGWVLDPFCGRGTTTFAARLRGLPTLGIDSNPVAVAIAAAKLCDVTPGAIIDEALAILGASNGDPEIPSTVFWRYAYAPRTLRQICILREVLRKSSGNDTRIALRAIVLGALHGPRGKTSPSYFSNQCPRTFAPKPDYAVSFWRRYKLRPVEVDIMRIIAERAIRYYGTRVRRARGRVVLADSCSRRPFGKRRCFAWVVTSPPFYGLRTYMQDQWLRNWFLGGSPAVDYRLGAQLEHTDPIGFADQLRAVWQNAAAVSVNGARLVCRFGQIGDRPVHPIDLMRVSLVGSGWNLYTIRPAGTARDGRRQAMQFGTSTTKPRNEYDFYAALSTS